MTLLGIALLVACDNHQTRPDGGPGALCGGIVFRPCSDTEFCDFPNNQCGIGDQTGICKPRPEVCTLIFDPVCACDGKIYGNQCAANSEGLDVNARGTCDLPSGSFECGYKQCDLRTQYCLRELDPSGADTYSCAALPACGSQPPTCACLANEPCGYACAGDATGGLTLTCP